MNLNTLKVVRKSSYVKRMHTVPVIGEQNLGHHCYNVCAIVIFIMEGWPSVELLKACLYHDVHELEIGDIPSPATRNSEAMSVSKNGLVEKFNELNDVNIKLDEEEKLALSWADKAELTYYCIDQINMGNRLCIPMLRKVLSYIDSLPNVGKSNELLSDINTKVRMLNPGVVL